MERITFDSALDTLAGLDSWLASLGIPVKKDRWHDALSMIRRAKEQREHIECGGELIPIPNYVPALFEAVEMLQVFRAFSGESSQVLRNKLSRALSGPTSPLLEQPRNNEARNTMFELVLAADWKNGGAIVELGEPDIRVKFGNTTFVVECKRPFYAHSVLANIKSAASQVKTMLETPQHQDSFGVVAVSLSRVFGSGNRMCFAPKDQGRRAIDEALIELIEQNKYQWKWNTANFHRRIAAVMFHVAVPWDVEGQQLICLSTSKFFEQAKCEGGGIRILRDNVSKLYPTSGQY